MIIQNVFAVHQSFITELQRLTNFYHQNKKFPSHYSVKIKISKAVSDFPFTSKSSWYSIYQSELKLRRWWHAMTEWLYTGSYVSSAVLSMRWSVGKQPLPAKALQNQLRVYSLTVGKLLFYSRRFTLNRKGFWSS